ncbi:MAG TPA: hypothetical protein VFF04_05180 [Candidatus Babeliales bacterium]|nr:hypothetical protein [Candidatus Babeliales bacterium]
MKYLRFLMILLPLANEGAEPTAKEKFQLALESSRALTGLIHQKKEKVIALQKEIQALQVELDETQKSVMESESAQAQSPVVLLALLKKVPAEDLQDFYSRSLKKDWDESERKVREAEIELKAFYPLAELCTMAKYTMGGRTYTFRDAQQKQNKAEAERTEIEKRMAQMLEMISKH